MVGFGLTLVPTPHRYLLDGHGLYTWCATDALMFTIILGRPAQVDSTCPATGTPIHIEISPDGIDACVPEGVAVSAVLPSTAVADIHGQACVHGHFFASAEAAIEWQAQHPAGTVRSLTDEFALARRTIGSLGWEGVTR